MNAQRQHHGSFPATYWRKVCAGGMAWLLLSATLVVADEKDSKAKKDELPPAAVSRLGAVGDTSWSHGVYSTTFSPDGKRVATRSSDQIIRVWELSSGEQIAELPECESGTIRDFAFSHDGRYMAVAVKEDKCTNNIWDLEQAKYVETNELPATFLVCRTQNEGVLAFVAKHQIILCDPSNAKEMRDGGGLKNLGREALPMTISHDRKRVLVPDRPVEQIQLNQFRSHVPRSNEHALVVLSAPPGRILRLGGFKTSVTHASWAPNGEEIAVTCRDDRKVHFRNTTKPDFKVAHTAHDASIQDVQYSPDGRHVVSVATNGSVRIWESLTRRVFGEFEEGEDRRLVSVDFSKDGRYLATGSAGKSDNSAIVWDWKELLLGSVVEPDDPRSELLTLWDALAEKDPRVAYAAIKRSLQRPTDAVALLRSKFGSESENMTREQIADWIGKLDDPSYQVRNAAHQALLQVRVSAADQLRAALDRGTASVETEVRLYKLLAISNGTSDMSSHDMRRLERAVYVLELIGTEQSRTLLNSIATGHPFEKIRQAAGESAKKAVRSGESL